jgi:hypothetical protein
MSITVFGSGGGAATPVPSPAVYVTMAYIQSLGIDPTSVTAQSIADANQLYAYLSGNPWMTQGQLATWSASNWGDTGVARLNAALALLTQATLIMQLGGS